MQIKRLLHRAAAVVVSAAMVLGMAATAYAKPDWPSDTGIMAGAGIAVDMDSKAVLFGQQIHVALPPASITKLLTALVVVENAEMDEMVTFSHDAVYNVESGSGNKLSLEEGDQLSVEDCLYVMLLLSSNQASNALAEHVAGSRDAFVDMMNEKIAALGCQESHFANPSGLNDETQNVSAYDMALIAIAAFENEKVLRISSSRSHSIPATINNPNGTSFKMEHRILMAENDPSSEYYCEGALAGKTGYTSLAGNTLVTLAERDGRKVVTVVLKGTQPQYYMDSRELLNFGLSSFQNVRIGEYETLLQGIGELELGGTVYQVSDLSLDQEAVVTLPETAEFADAERSVVTELPEDAPLGAAALVQYTYNERKIGAAYLYSDSLKETQLAAIQAAEAEKVKAASGPVMEESDSAADKTETESKEETKNSGESGAAVGGLVPKVLIAAVIIAAAAGAIIFFKKKRQRELEAAALRRERRRQRLQEIGCSEEEFEKMVQERRAKNRQEQ